MSYPSIAATVVASDGKGRASPLVHQRSRQTIDYSSVISESSGAVVTSNTVCGVDGTRSLQNRETVCTLVNRLGEPTQWQLPSIVVRSTASLADRVQHVQLNRASTDLGGIAPGSCRFH